MLLTLSAVLVSPWLVPLIGARRGVLVGFFGYLVYAGAQFYPGYSTLMPAAAVFGLAAAVFWASVFTYLSQVHYKLIIY